MSLAQIREAPEKGLILVVGPPGVGKSTFCHEVTLGSLAAQRPVIFLTTERSVPDTLELLKERGLGDSVPATLRFVDAFTETVGLTAAPRPDTRYANCADLNSLSIAITKLQQRAGPEGNLLVIDSLTSPYLLSGPEIIRFVQLFLSRFAAQGNAVFAVLDEGCGREEDLVALMSVADGIIQIEMENSSRVLHVVKHPVYAPTRISSAAAHSEAVPLQAMDAFVTKHYLAVQSRFQNAFRSEVGDLVHLLWGKLMFWGGMLWDAKRFPTMLYHFNKKLTYLGALVYVTKLPWPVRLTWRLAPAAVCRPPGFVHKRILPILAKPFREAGGGILEYIPDQSCADDHYFRIYEGASCCGLEDVGARLCYDDAAYLAGMMKYFDKERRDWDAVEIACMGEGAPCCEFNVRPREQPQLQAYLTAMDSSRLETITYRLMENVTEFIRHGELLCDRPTLGAKLHWLPFLQVPASMNPKYQMALRMGGVMTGKRLAEHVMDAGIPQEEAIPTAFDLMRYCNAGKITLDGTVRMVENCESCGWQAEEPSCFFTTGFLNGLFSTVKGQHVREIKCVALGHPYCEWEIG
jgi:predicted hydrocarbon binding protein/KaiC/GvpD/RAD55 family RecA-like ATPase